MLSKGIGASVTRKEDRPFVTGRGRYMDDVQLPGMLHLHFVRSPLAHARLLAVDAEAARSAPGVVAVLTAADLPLVADVPVAGAKGDEPLQPPLARERVRFVGEPVAVVVAETRYQAADAAQLVELDLDPLPVVVEAEAALAEGAPQLHEGVERNVAASRERRKEFEQAVASAEVVVEQRIVNQRVSPAPLEGRGAVARCLPGGEATVYLSTQIPHVAKSFIAGSAGIPESRLRLIAPDVGGGFGAKINVFAEELVTVAASLALGGAPVKWVEDRTENLLAMTHGRDQVQTVRLHATRDGRILGLELHVVANVGAYPQLVSVGIPSLTAMMATGCYAIPALATRVDCVYTNTAPVSAYRGAGRPEAAHMIERMVDVLARRLDLDPAEVRRRNFVAEFPYRTRGGATYDASDYHRTLERALELAGYEELRREQREARAQGRLLGVGLSTWVEVCGFGPSEGTKPGDLAGWESATLRLHPDGRATIVSGTSPHGQGHATTFAQIVESELGVPWEDVELVHGDTAFAPYGIGTHGSRSAAVGGSALLLTARKLREKATRLAAHLLEAAVDDVEFEAGRFFVAGSPERAVTIQEVAAQALAAGRLPEGEEPGLEAQTFYDPTALTFPSGCHVCVVEVDRDTGSVTILRYLGVDDFGRVINPLIVDGQLHGGIAQAIGQALYEETLYDEDGQNLTATLLDYMFPSAAELPRFETAREETPTDTNPLGVKGVGEAGTIAASAAVVNAVCDALGVEHLDMPLRPERVWRAIA